MTVETYLRGLLETGISPAEVTDPTDIFCLAAGLISKAGTYTKDRLSEEDKTSFASSAEVLHNKWLQFYSAYAGSRINPALTSNSVAKELQGILCAADGLCKGYGLPGNAYDDVRFHADRRLQANHHGSTLCTELIRKDVARVLPKGQVPHPGNTLRKLSENVCFLEGEDVRTIWSTIPLATKSATSYRLLVVPWPLEITNLQLHATQDGKFTFDPAATNGEIAWRLMRLIDETERKAGNIDLVVLPELALNREDYLLARDVLAQRNIALVTGLGGPSRYGGVENRMVIDVPLGGGYVMHLRQRKHHQWYLDPAQINQYGFGSQFDAAKTYWEDIDVSSRYVNFMGLNSKLIMCVLICEDLARHEPVGNYVRSVGPDLVIALLMDGPQLQQRWPGRYAGVLADDPGSSVLTVTSIGMCERSPFPRGSGETSRKIASWRDRNGNCEELSLPSGADALLLTIGYQNRSEVVRSVPVLSGVMPIKDPGPNSLSKVFPKRCREISSQSASTLSRIARYAMSEMKDDEKFYRAYYLAHSELDHDARDIARNIVAPPKDENREPSYLAAMHFRRWAVHANK